MAHQWPWNKVSPACTIRVSAHSTIQQRCGVTAEMVGSAIKVLLERESYAYTTLWESLTLSQRRFLRGLALEPPKMRPFLPNSSRGMALARPPTPRELSKGSWAKTSLTATTDRSSVNE